jgi:hypothetical protein
MAKAKKDEKKGFWFVTFSDGGIEVFDSKKTAKKHMKKWKKNPDEGNGTFPLYLNGPVVHLEVEVRPSDVRYSIIESGEGFTEEDLTD